MSRSARVPAARVADAPAGRERDDKYFSKAVGKALDVIDILRGSALPLTLNELTMRIQLAKSSVFRILHTLEAAGYIQRDASGRYVVAPELRTTGPSQLRSVLVEAAAHALKELGREFRETVSLAIRFENRIEVVATIESPHLIRMGNTVGRIVPPYASSLGKSVAAFQPEDVRERLVRSYGIHAFTERTLTDEVELKREFERVRSRGYSTDIEESVLEGCCFGVPILDSRAEAIAAISISVPKMRIRDDQLQKRIIGTLRRAADSMARQCVKRS